MIDFPDSNLYPVIVTSLSYQAAMARTLADEMNDKKITVILTNVFAAILPLALLIYLKYPIFGSTLRGTPNGAFNVAIHGKMVRMADENALTGMQNKADGEKVRALVRYLIALTLLPKDEITEPRRRAYLTGFSLTTRSF